MTEKKKVGRCQSCKKDVKAILIKENSIGTWWTCDECKSTFLQLPEWAKKGFGRHEDD